MNVLWLQQSETQVPPGTHWLSPGETAHLNGLRFPKRQCDWRLGRWTAKRAIALYLGDPSPALLNQIEICPAPSGAPEVFLAGQPADFSISLSHRLGAAMVALTPSRGPVGCDLESIEAHSASFVADYFTPQEQLVIRRSSACDHDALVALLWSLKESALKALHQGLRLDPRQLLVTFALNAGPTCENLHRCQEGLSHIPPVIGGPSAQHPWHHVTVTLNRDFVLHGCWQRSASLVRTLIADAALLPPASLDCPN